MYKSYFFDFPVVLFGLLGLVLAFVVSQIGGMILQVCIHKITGSVAFSFYRTYPNIWTSPFVGDDTLSWEATAMIEFY